MAAFGLHRRITLVKETCLDKTEIVLNGDIPQKEPKVVSSGSLKQQIKPVKKTVEIPLNKKMPSGKNRVARSEPRQQPVTTKQGGATGQADKAFR